MTNIPVINPIKDMSPLSDYDEKFINSLKELLLKQEHYNFKKYSSDIHTIYQFYNYGRDDDSVYISNVEDYIKNLTDYFSGKNTIPPELKLPTEGFGHFRRNLFKIYLNLEPTQKDTNKIFHGILQSIPMSDLIYIVHSLCKKSGYQENLLQLLNINFQKDIIFNDEQLNSSNFNKCISSIHTSRSYDKDKLSEGLHNFFKFHEVIIKEPSQVNFYHQPQRKILELIQKTLPLDYWKQFESYYPLHVTSNTNTSNKKDNNTLFSIPSYPSISVTLDYSYIANKFPNLFLTNDIIKMNDIILDYLLLENNKTLLNISNIININKNDKKEETTLNLLIFSNNLEPVNTKRFFDIYEKIISVYSTHKTTIKNPDLIAIKEFEKSVLFYAFNEIIEDKNTNASTPSKRNKI